MRRQKTMPPCGRESGMSKPRAIRARAPCAPPLGACDPLHRGALGPRPPAAGVHLPPCACAPLPHGAHGLVLLAARVPRLHGAGAPAPPLAAGAPAPPLAAGAPAPL